MSITSANDKTIIFPMYDRAPSTIYDQDIHDIDCERELFPVNYSSHSNTTSRTPSVQSAVNSDSESYRSSLNSSRSSTPDLRECRNPDTVRKTIKQGKKYGPGSEKTVMVGNHEYTLDSAINSDSESYRSSLNSSRSSTPDLLECWNPKPLKEIIKEWKKYSPGSEKTVMVGNHEYSVNLERIGGGSFKQVHSGFSKTDQAIAVIYANTSTENKKQFTENELNALQLCEIQNISGTPRLLDSSYQIGRDWKRFIITFCEEGTINQWADGKKLFDKLKILLGVARTLEEMHKLECAHLDIKSENIGIHDGKSIVLDFGLFTIQGAKRDNQGMTMAYAPPGNKPSTAIQSDVFSFGVTLYEIIQENVKCGALCEAVMSQKGWDTPVAYLYSTTQADIDGAIEQLDTPEELKNLLFSVLKVNPEERISSAQARIELEKIVNTTLDKW